MTKHTPGANLIPAINKLIDYGVQHLVQCVPLADDAVLIEAKACQREWRERRATYALAPELAEALRKIIGGSASPVDLSTAMVEAEALLARLEEE